ncbi:MAG: hypothetical protein ACREP9_15805, partial [Candidatus Dormibacteraceae bacterium]
LIVCPAQARYVWHHPKRAGFGQLDRWWPDHPVVGVVEPGKPMPVTPIVVVSYEMLPRFLKETWEVPSAIVFDEIHYLQNSRA